MPSINNLRKTDEKQAHKSAPDKIRERLTVSSVVLQDTSLGFLGFINFWIHDSDSLKVVGQYSSSHNSSDTFPDYESL